MFIILTWSQVYSTSLSTTLTHLWWGWTRPKAGHQGERPPQGSPTCDAATALASDWGAAPAHGSAPPLPQGHEGTDHSGQILEGNHLLILTTFYPFPFTSPLLYSSVSVTYSPLPSSLMFCYTSKQVRKAHILECFCASPPPFKRLYLNVHIF